MEKYLSCKVKHSLRRIQLLFFFMNMEITTNSKVVKFRATNVQSIGYLLIAHLNANSWLQKLSKLL